MTITQAKKKLVDWCNSQVGTREGGDNWNKYAENPDLTKWYGWKPQNQPWCDVFADSAFLTCFGLKNASAMTYQPVGKGSALCRASAMFYKNAGAWHKTPEVGDQVFFYVGGAINHTGIVTNVGMGAITTVEGNSSDMVARRTYAISSPAIAGYGRPRWSVVAEGNESVPKPSYDYNSYVYPVKVNLLKKGNYGPQVANMQHLLKDHGFYKGEIDGQFGGETFTAVKAFQEAAKIGVDGEWGGETFNAMWNYKG